MLPKNIQNYKRAVAKTNVVSNAPEYIKNLPPMWCFCYVEKAEFV